MWRRGRSWNWVATPTPIRSATSAARRVATSDRASRVTSSREDLSTWPAQKRAQRCDLHPAGPSNRSAEHGAQRPCERKGRPEASAAMRPTIWESCRPGASAAMRPPVSENPLARKRAQRCAPPSRKSRREGASAAMRPPVWENPTARKQAQRCAHLLPPSRLDASGARVGRRRRGRRSTRYADERATTPREMHDASRLRDGASLGGSSGFRIPPVSAAKSVPADPANSSAP